MKLGGHLREYLDGVREQWLLVAPLANPAMLEMYRDRNATPLRFLEPWSGEFAGKYLVAAVQNLRTNGDGRLRSWLEAFVGRLIALQAPNGYLGAWPTAYELTNDSPNAAHDDGTWDTWSHYHVMMGLLLWYEESGEEGVLASARKIGDLLCEKYLGDVSPRLVETGKGFTECNLAPAHGLCVLHRKTGEGRYLELAKQLIGEFSVKDAEGRPLAGDYYAQALAGKEFFETPKPRWESLHPIMALAELYWITGEVSYRQAFEQLWWSIAAYDRHNNGGFTSGEQATGNPYHLAQIESCCTIAWAAMSVEMLKLTGEPKVADELELTLLNSVVGMFSRTGRWATYNTPMTGIRRASGQSIVFQAREGSPELNCCSVNAPRGFGLLSEWGMMRDGEGIVVNHYGPGVCAVPLSGDLTVRLLQETAYPVEPTIRIVVEPSHAGVFALKLRLPHWSERSRVAVNGEAAEGVRAGCYVKLERRWEAGDVIELELDFRLRGWRGERECEGLVALYRGPLLLAYDMRYNLERCQSGVPQVRELNEWSQEARPLEVPALQAEGLEGKVVGWEDWLPPLLLLEFTAMDGKPVRLCDYGSAGETGTVYTSWVPMEPMPAGVGFTRENPLRTVWLS